VSGGAINGATVSPITDTWSASSTSPGWRESRVPAARLRPATHPGNNGEGDRVCAFGRERLSLRPTHGHHHPGVKVGAVEIAQRLSRSHAPGPTVR